MEPAFNDLVVESGGDDQRDIEIISLAKLLPRGRGVHQPRDRDQRFSYRTETPGRYGSMVNGQADPYSGLPVFPVHVSETAGQFAWVVSHQRQPVGPFRENGEFPVPGGQPVPAVTVQACGVGGPGQRRLKSILGPDLLGRVALAVARDVNCDEIPERQALASQRLHPDTETGARTQPFHNVTLSLMRHFLYPPEMNQAISMANRPRTAERAQSQDSSRSRKKQEKMTHDQE